MVQVYGAKARTAKLFPIFFPSPSLTTGNPPTFATKYCVAGSKKEARQAIYI